MQAANATDTASRQEQQPQDVQQAKAELATSTPSAGDATPATAPLAADPASSQPSAAQVRIIDYFQHVLLTSM